MLDVKIHISTAVRYVICVALCDTLSAFLQHILDHIHQPSTSSLRFCCIQDVIIIKLISQHVKNVYHQLSSFMHTLRSCHDLFAPGCHDNNSCLVTGSCVTNNSTSAVQDCDFFAVFSSQFSSCFVKFMFNLFHMLSLVRHVQVDMCLNSQLFTSRFVINCFLLGEMMKTLQFGLVH